MYGLELVRFNAVVQTQLYIGRMEMALKYNSGIEARVYSNQGLSCFVTFFSRIVGSSNSWIREEHIQLVKVLNCRRKNADTKLIRAQLEFWVRQSECTSLVWQLSYVSAANLSRW